MTACGQAAPPLPPSESKAPVSRATAATMTGWQQRWNTTVEEAKKEGNLSMSVIGWDSEVRKTVTQAFYDRYGIKIEFSPFARGEELLAKVLAEQRAGLYTTDAFGVGGSTQTMLKNEGVLGQPTPLLILPEVIDPNVWTGGKLPFLDHDKLMIAFLSGKSSQIMYNTGLIKKGELTSYKDVLKPEYKGKLTLNDPSVSGAGNAFLTNLALNVWNEEEAKAFLRQLIKQQDVLIQRDNRLHVETVARGKYAIGLAPNADNMNNFLAMGAPIDVAYAREGTYTGPSSGIIAVPTKLAHPNATAVFVNWLLSKEGQTLFVRGFGRPSMRIDVSTEGLPAQLVAQPGEKLFLYSEDFVLSSAKMVGVARQVIEEAMK